MRSRRPRFYFLEAGLVLSEESRGDSEGLRRVRTPRSGVLCILERDIDGNSTLAESVGEAVGRRSDLEVSYDASHELEEKVRGVLVRRHRWRTRVVHKFFLFHLIHSAAYDF